MTWTLRISGSDIVFECPECGREIERIADGDDIETDDIGGCRSCDPHALNE